LKCALTKIICVDTYVKVLHMHEVQDLCKIKRYKVLVAAVETHNSLPFLLFHADPLRTTLSSHRRTHTNIAQLAGTQRIEEHAKGAGLSHVATTMGVEPCQFRSKEHTATSNMPS